MRLTTYTLFVFSLLFGFGVQAQTNWPTYDTDPAIYNGDECVQLHDIAIVGLPNQTDVEFICLTPFASGEAIHFYSMELKNGAWSASVKENTFTFSSDVARGTFVRAAEGGVVMSAPGSATLTAGGGTWVVDMGDWSPNGTDPVFVADFGTPGGSLNTILDYVVNSDVALELGQVRTDFASITGGLEVPLSSLYAPQVGNGANATPEIIYDFHYNYPQQITGTYGKGWPGFLEARRDLVNWTSVNPAIASRAVGWDDLAASWNVVTPSSEALLLINQGGSTIDDTQAAVLNQDATIDSVVIPVNIDLNLAVASSFTKPFKIKSGRRLGLTGAAPSGPKLILESNSSGSAGLGTQNVAFTMDEVIIERHIPGTTLGVGNGFVNGGSEVSWVNIGNLLPGLTAGDVLSQLPQVANLALYAYDNATRTYTALTGTAPLSSPWDPVSPSYDGYFLLLPSNADGYTLQFAQVDVTIPADPATLTIPLETGGIGWNLLVNPFASAISVTALFAENEEIQTVSVYGGAANLYDYSNRSGTLDAISVIESGQAFWVNSLSTTSGNPVTQLSLSPATVKSDVNAAFIREENSNLQGVVKITAYEEEAPHLPASTYIEFNAEGQVDYDVTDVHYSSSMSSSRFEIWTTATDDLGETNKLLLQSTGDLSHSNDIPLVIEAKQGGNVMVKLEEHELGLDISCARLSDLETGETWQLSYDTPIALSVEPNVTYTDRFVLDFSATPEKTIKNGFCAGGVVELDVETSGIPMLVELLDEVTGEVVATSTSELAQLSPSTYTLTMEMTDGCIAEYSFEIASKCMGELNDNDMRDVQDLMGILTYIGNDTVDYDEIDSKGIDCDCDQVMTNMDILTFLSAFGQGCD